MLFLITLIPLFGFLACGLLGRFLGQRGAVLVSSVFMAANCGFSILLFVLLSTSQEIYTLIIGNWINSGLLNVNWGFYIDNLTIVMLLIVNGVSTVVHLYSRDYMLYDAHLVRFMSYLSLFTFFMLVLITGDSLITLFLGWEGVGLCSYLLISFWFTRVLANKSAMKAMIVNRVSDFGLTIGIIIVFFIFQSVDFSAFLGVVPYFANHVVFLCKYCCPAIECLALLLFVGAMGKSAQIGLHTWLPDAMEGPTPVSALIHAATMVTAGVFLVIKCAALFEYAPLVLFVVSTIGAFTAFFAATAGLVQSDLKKVIAYSTCSQLGYMFFVCGLSGYQFGLFHLVNHAFFKALLFLSAGAVIHSISSEQDMRKFGGTVRLVPFTYIMMLIGSLSLMGFPFLTGYYSKDLIIEMAYATYNQIGHAVYWCGLLTALLTSFYSVRLLVLTFLTSAQSVTVSLLKKVHDVPGFMMVALGLLSFGSIFWGYLTKDFMVGVGTTFWNTSIFILPANNHLVEAEFLHICVKLTPTLWSMIMIGVVFYIQNLFSNKIERLTWLRFFFTTTFNRIYRFFSNKWYFDIIYNYYINARTLHYSYNTLVKLVDKGILEVLGPMGSFNVLYCGSQKYILRQQSGLLYMYAWSIGGSLILFVLIFNYCDLFFI